MVVEKQDARIRCCCGHEADKEEGVSVEMGHDGVNQRVVMDKYTVERIGTVDVACAGVE